MSYTDPAAPAAPQIPASPWQQDLQQRFTDPAQAAAVDAYLRERWQPRVTQLEQQYAETQPARELLTSFQNDPVATFNGVRQELINAGYTVEQATTAAQQQYDASQAAPPAAPVQAAAAQTEDPRLAEMYADWQQQKQLTAYDHEITQIVNNPANADVNPNLYHHFVASADGDFGKALEHYRGAVAQVLVDYGIDPANATRVQAEAAAQVAGDAQAAANGAPAVMGAGSGGAGAPVPTQPDYVAQGLTPVQALHRGIEDAAANMLRSGQTAPPIA